MLIPPPLYLQPYIADLLLLHSVAIDAKGKNRFGVSSIAKPPAIGTRAVMVV